MKNNKGFAIFETIIVISILALGLISLYSTYNIIIRKSLNNRVEQPKDIYLAYQISNYKNYTTSGIYYYVEIYKNGNTYYRRNCGVSTCSGSTALSNEENTIYSTLDIDKIYFTNKKVSDLLTRNVLLMFDGSTINYLNSIKNDEYINDSARYTVIVKTDGNNSKSFSYYQVL